MLDGLRTRYHEYKENIIFAKRFFCAPWCRRFVLMQTPEHNNVGDSLLVTSSLSLLKDYFPNGKIVEITEKEYYRYLKIMKAIIRKKDTVLIHAGGNMGTIWRAQEEIRRSIIREFPKNKIVSFPQTIYYAKDEEAQRYLKQSQEIYSAHNDLTLFAREKISYKLMRETYGRNRVELTPDIALYVGKYPEREREDIVLLCLRDDTEKALSETDHRLITDALGKNKYRFMDMYSDDEAIYPMYREEEINKKYEEFARAKLVITDRLHGMVMAAQTQTPCVVFGNNHYKVKGVYEWLKDLDYVEYIDDIGDIQAAIDKVMAVDKPCYPTEKFRPYFAKLVDGIKGV